MSLMSPSLSRQSKAMEILVDPYLLREIFENFHCSWNEKGSGEGAELNAQLLRIALVCKAFLGPALDVLWHTLDSLFPICCTLTSSLQECGGEWILPITSQLPLDDVARFKSYAKRVRIAVTNISRGSPLEGLLCWATEFRGSKISKKTFKHVLKLLSKDIPVFFPNLRAVMAMNILEPEFVQVVLPALAGPELRHLDFNCALAVDPLKRAMIRGVVQCLPSMTGLKCLHITATHADELYACLPAMYSLESLKLGDLENIPSLEMLGNLRCLKQLEIWKSGPYKLKEPLVSGLTSSESSLWFPSLEELTVWGGPFDIAMLFGSIRSKVLRKIYVVLFPPSPNEDMIKLLDKAMYKWGDILVDLGMKTITRAHLPDRFKTFKAVSFSLLDSTLPTFKYLQKIRLDLQPMLDVDFDLFAAAFPNARAIHLVDFNVATYKNLCAFARSCPRLQELTVEVHCEDICSSDRGSRGKTQSSSPLVSLFVGRSKYREGLEPVKESLSSIFPAIREIRAYKDEFPHIDLSVEGLFEATSAMMSLGKWNPDSQDKSFNQG